MCRENTLHPELVVLRPVPSVEWKECMAIQYADIERCSVNLEPGSVDVGALVGLYACLKSASAGHDSILYLLVMLKPGVVLAEESAGGRKSGIVVFYRGSSIVREAGLSSILDVADTIDVTIRVRGAPALRLLVHEELARRASWSLRPISGSAPSVTIIVGDVGLDLKLLGSEGEGGMVQLRVLARQHGGNLAYDYGFLLPFDARSEFVLLDSGGVDVGRLLGLATMPDRGGGESLVKMAVMDPVYQGLELIRAKDKYHIIYEAGAMRGQYLIDALLDEAEARRIINTLNCFTEALSRLGVPTRN